MQQEYNISFSINKDHTLLACVTLYSLLKNNQNYYFNCNENLLNGTESIV